ncbi:MAG: hypothetical protein FVQ82_02985 [Planctomycetes bacterium]|nr:hypothetical protein [Planctomycetota bacterium]
MSHKLLEFIISAQDNTIATLHNFENTPVIQAMFTIDELFNEISVIKHRYSKELLLPLFVSRCHSTFLGAVRLITSGQVVETYMLLRGCIENALYAHFIQTDPTLDTDSPERMFIWLKREDDEKSRKVCRNMFSYSKLKKNLINHSSELGSKISDLYEHTLDYGAHPNFLGHITTSDIKIDGGSVDILVSGDTDICKVGLQTTVKVGVVSLKMFELIYGSRFEGITEKLSSLDWAIEKT